MTTELRPGEYTYNGEYDHICNWCAHSMTAIVSVNRNERGWQCHHCGYTWSRTTSRQLHTLIRQNVYRYLSEYPASLRPQLAWFRLPGHKPFHYDPDTGWRVYDTP